MTRYGISGGKRRKLRAGTALALGLPLIFASIAAPAAAFGAPTAPSASQKTASQKTAQNFHDGRYIVMLDEKPLATYDGGVSGITATKPVEGRKLDAGSANARKYQSRLEQKQNQLAASAGVRIRQKYTAAVNGFAADLTAAQAANLAKDPSVLSVTADVQHKPDYSSTDYLQLRGNRGVWARQFGGEVNAGKGVVVGVIDTGYYPQSQYLAGAPVRPLSGKARVGEPYRTADGKIAMLKSDGSTFTGECQAGQDFAGTECNSKVLSARYFDDTFVATVPPEERAPEERLSPIDVASHGTHTASTAVGNNNVQQTVDGRDFGKGSGVAPAAKLAVYKICWEDKDPNTGGCYSSAAVAAINQAVTDGVDVLNFSISGDNSSISDPVSMAFYSAASVGIFVAASAGNDGPAAGTVNHSAPWLTTVAASTFSNELQGTVELSDGTKYRGASIMSHEVPQTPLVLAGTAAAAGKTAADAALCQPGTLDPAKTTGKIVVCDRGVNARAEKSTVVKAAGGVGMVLVNLTPNSLDLDLHAVPTVHINDPSIKNRIAANPSLTAALVDHDTTGTPDSPLPQIAAFSSRGPSGAAGSDLLKPDVAAPGVGVLAGVSPVIGGQTAGFMSGTSMAAPHVAGVGALLLSKNPKWSPATIKSALMTTASAVVNADGTRNTDVFATGAGEVNTRRMDDPGLVYDSGPTQWKALLDGKLAAKDVNVPSFALGNLTGKTTVTRTLTATERGQYRVSANVPGISVKVSPSVLTFAKPGQARSFKVTFENDGAALDAFVKGSITWSGQGTTVASPVAVRPVTAVAPASVSYTSTQASGTGRFQVTSGTDHPIHMSVKGLAKANSTAVEKTPGAPSTTDDEHNSVTAVNVPSGTSLVKFAVNSANPGADWDLYVFSPSGEFITTAATPASSEALVLNNPEPGEYTVIANLFASPGGAAVKASVEATVLGGDEGNLTLSPNPLRLRNGSSATLTAAWKSLAPGNYVGQVQYGPAGAVTAVNIAVQADGSAAFTPASGSAVQVLDGAARPSAASGT